MFSCTGHMCPRFGLWLVDTPLVHLHWLILTHTILTPLLSFVTVNLSILLRGMDDFILTHALSVFLSNSFLNVK